MRTDMEREGEGMPRRRLNSREKTMRAYSAYLELTDAAGWMRGELASQINILGFTMMDFRILNVLNREPQYLEGMSKRLNIQKQVVAKVVKRLRAAGWVRRRRRRLAPSFERWNFEIERGLKPGGTKPRGRLVNLLEMTEGGRVHFQRIRPKHMKLVKACMRALDQREQLTLARLCMKLRRGNVLKFASELRWWDRDEDWAEVVARR
jgi:DNA-binding MarR family transcriptional regulator